MLHINPITISALVLPSLHPYHLSLWSSVEQSTSSSKTPVPIYQTTPYHSLETLNFIGGNIFHIPHTHLGNVDGTGEEYSQRMKFFYYSSMKPPYTHNPSFSSTFIRQPKIFYWFQLPCLHYATNWQAAGSIPDGVIGIFQWHNPSCRSGVDSASNRNAYQVYFLAVKAAGA